MAFLTLSDVHIYSDHDPILDRLIEVFKWAHKQKLNQLFLLGDIFDLMVGEHREYLTNYQKFFEELRVLINAGTEVHFVEGNHDFHLRKIYQEIGANYHKKSYQLQVDGKKFYLAHGDEIQLENFDYLIMKKIINNPFCERLAGVLPYSPLDKLGKNLSQASRKRNSTRYQEESSQKVKELFRKSVDAFSQKERFDYIILGHSHVLDEYQSPKGFTYFNNGYVKMTQKILLYQEGKFKFTDLSSFRE